jgi:hypothetical protein
MPPPGAPPPEGGPPWAKAVPMTLRESISTNEIIMPNFFRKVLFLIVFPFLSVNMLYSPNKNGLFLLFANHEEHEEHEETIYCKG